MGEIEEILDEVDLKYNSLKNFDVIPGYTSPYDHHFFQSPMFGNKHSKSTIHKIIDRVWVPLMTNDLPKSILIRVYKNEDYVDLMRAVIVGPEGTPYCYSLFFFDICIPADYPNSPPKFYYHSQGHSINNYLRKDGTVSHPLLNMWNPRTSNLLNVLVSIPNWLLRNCDMDNEVFKLSCERMVRTLNTPPREFEDFVKGHFRLYSHLILLSCKQYLENGAKMGRLVEYLYDRFERNGSYVKHHKHLLEYKLDEEENQGEWVVKGKNDVLSKTWMNFKAMACNSLATYEL